MEIEESKLNEEEEEDIESSHSKTTSDEDYQNPLEKGMVMEEYEDEDEFIGMQEEIPSHKEEIKKNTRKGNRRGSKRKRLLESEDAGESSNSSSVFQA